MRVEHELVCSVLERQLGKRCVLIGKRISPEGRELWLLSEPGAHRVQYVAKELRDARQGEAARYAQQRLTPQRPVWFDPHSRLLIREWIEGESLDRLPVEMMLARMPLVGRVLSAIHAVSPPDWPTKHWGSWRDMLLRDLPRLIDAVSPHDAVLIQRAVTRAEAIDRRHPTRTQPVLLHGDFQLRQVIETHAGLEVIDWDDACCGEREFDVAYFLAYLRSHLDPLAAQRGSLLFLDAYRSQEPLHAPRMLLWNGYNVLRRALRRQRLQDADYETERDRMLSQLSNWLDETQTLVG